MRAWWRSHPLDPAECYLLAVLTEAHRQGSWRQNPSSVAVSIAAHASASYVQSIGAALLTLGGIHGPLVATYDLLAHPEPVVEAGRRLEAGQLVPGWGHSFVKGKLDPSLELVMLALNEFPTVYNTIDQMSRLMLNAKGIYPNPSAFTAATALVVGLPRECVAWLVVQARLPEWSTIYRDHVEVPSWAT